MSLIVTKDTLTPELARMARRVSDTTPVLEAMGLAVVSISKRAFNDPSLRPLPWAPTKEQGGAPLKASGAMWQSLRIAELTKDHVQVGTDRPYAPWHQFGTDPYTIRPSTKKALFWPGAAHPVGKVNHPGLPPRPFFPFSESGEMTPGAKTQVREAAAAKLRSVLQLPR